MLGDMHVNIGNDISGNQNILYLGTRKFQKLTDLDIYLHKFNLAKKYIPKRIDPKSQYTSLISSPKSQSFMSAENSSPPRIRHLFSHPKSQSFNVGR